MRKGATFLAGHGTAYYGLVDRAQIKPGETLLVHGAAGGVGLAAVELGKAYGAKVIAVASTEEKLAVAKARGADHVLLSGEPFRDKVKEFTDGRGADVVFDPVGGPVFEESVRCINWGARLCIVGFLQGVGVAKTNLVLIKNASVLGIRAGEAMRRDPSLAGPRQRDLMRPGGGGQDLAQRLASPAAGALGRSDAAVDRPQGDRARGAGDGARRIRQVREVRAAMTQRSGQ